MKERNNLFQVVNGSIYGYVWGGGGVVKKVYRIVRLYTARGKRGK